MTDRPELELSDELAEELAAVDALPPYLTRAEAWTFLRVSEATLDRALERGELTRRRLGGRTVIPRAGIRAWVLREAGAGPDAGRGNLVELCGRLEVPKPTTEGSPT